MTSAARTAPAATLLPVAHDPGHVRPSPSGTEALRGALPSRAVDADLLAGRWRIDARRLPTGGTVALVWLRLHAPDGHDEVFLGRTRPVVPVSATNRLTPRWWAAFAKTAAVQLEDVVRLDLVDQLPVDDGVPTVVVRFASIGRGTPVILDAENEVIVHEFDVVRPPSPTGP